MSIYSFNSPYAFGDKVEFDSLNGKGVGVIITICLSEDGSIFYSIECGDSMDEHSYINGCVEVHEIKKLISNDSRL